MTRPKIMALVGLTAVVLVVAVTAFLGERGHAGVRIVLVKETGELIRNEPVLLSVSGANEQTVTTELGELITSMFLTSDGWIVPNSITLWPVRVDRGVRGQVLMRTCVPARIKVVDALGRGVPDALVRHWSWPGQTQVDTNLDGIAVTRLPVGLAMECEVLVRAPSVTRASVMATHAFKVLEIRISGLELALVEWPGDSVESGSELLLQYRDATDGGRVDARQVWHSIAHFDVSHRYNLAVNASRYETGGVHRFFLRDPLANTWGLSKEVTALQGTLLVSRSSGGRVRGGFEHTELAPRGGFFRVTAVATNRVLGVEVKAPVHEGSFSMSALPPGEWEFHTTRTHEVHGRPDHRSTIVTAEIRAGEEVPVEVPLPK